MKLGFDTNSPEVSLLTGPDQTTDQRLLSQAFDTNMPGETLRLLSQRPNNFLTKQDYVPEWVPSGGKAIYLHLMNIFELLKSMSYKVNTSSNNAFFQDQPIFCVPGFRFDRLMGKGNNYSLGQLFDDKKVSLVGAYIPGARFEGVNLGHIHMSNAVVGESSFKGASSQGGIFNGLDFSRCVDLTEIQFDNCLMDGTKFSSSNDLEGAKLTNLSANFIYIDDKKYDIRDESEKEEVGNWFHSKGVKDFSVYTLLRIPVLE